MRWVVWECFPDGRLFYCAWRETHDEARQVAEYLNRERPHDMDLWHETYHVALPDTKGFISG